MVSGVLVALAMNSVYQARLDRGRERIYLTQLLGDLRETERLMDAADSVNAPWDRSLEALVQTFRVAAVPERDSILRWSLDVQFDDPAPVLGTADALVETGDLQLIRDPEIRSAVTSYLSKAREYNLPWLIDVEQDFLNARTQFRSKVDLLEAKFATGALPTTRDVGERDPFPLDVERFRNDPEAYTLLTRMMLDKQDCLLARRLMRDEAGVLRRKVEGQFAD